MSGRPVLLFLSALLLGVVGFSLYSESDSVPSASIQHQVFQMELVAEFMAPGWQRTIETRGDELAFGPVDWISVNEGHVAAKMWGVFAAVEFETDASRKKLQELRIEPLVGNPIESRWNLWRHRHGYQFFYGKGYFLNTLADIRPAVDPMKAVFYDRLLKNDWGYWVKKRLADYLATGDTTRGANWASSDRESKANMRMQKPIRLRYSTDGLHGSYPTLFQINLWDVPVKIDFEMVPSSAPTSSEDWIALTHGYRWKFDMAEWRRRHGYHKNFLGHYAWDEGFPDRNPLTEEQGLILDEFLQHAVESWVEVAVTQVIANLDRKLTRAIAALATTKTRPAEEPIPPALEQKADDH